MPLTLTVKKNIDNLVPLAGAVAAGWFSFKKTKGDWRYIIFVSVIAFAVLYVITSQVTKSIFTSGPANVPVGAGCDNYDPTGLMSGIYADTTCWFCTRTRSLYDTLVGLSDCQLRACYNYWNDTYYSKTGTTLPAQIATQSNFWDALFGQQQQSIAAKFQTLGLQ